MSTEAELDAITQTRGTCPICAEDGKTVKKQLHGLASHLMKEHTVDQLVYQIAGEAVIDALDEQETPKFATGGFIEAPEGAEPPIIARGCDFVVDEAYLFTKDRPFPESARVYLDRWVKTGQPLNAEEARQAEDAGLRVVEATSFEDEEPKFVPVDDTGRPDPD